MEEKPEKRKRHTIPDKRKLANLVQFRDLSEEEFDELYNEKYKVADSEIEASFEKRIEIKMEEFEKDYDLTDLKINDKETLRALIQAIISLEDYEQILFRLRTKGIDVDNIYFFEKVNKVMSDLRADISKLQDDLKITRKIRKSDQETSFLQLIENLKEKARKFYESKMNYVFCPKCNTLIATVWFLYPELKTNKLKLHCGKKLVSGEVCSGEILIGSKELLELGGYSNKSIIPERMA